MTKPLASGEVALWALLVGFLSGIAIGMLLWR